MFRGGIKGILFLFFVFATVIQLFSFPVSAIENHSASSDRIELKKLIINKEDVTSLKSAFDIYSRLIPNNPQDYELRVQGADDVYYLASLTPDKSEKKNYLSLGIEWSKQAIALQPNKAGGHFYYGILTGLKAEVSGILVGLRSKDIIKEEMEKVVQIEPGYSNGDAHLALGRWYMGVPSFMGGNTNLAKEHLQKAIAIYPNSTKARVALAELYMKDYQYDQAKKEIDAVLATPITASNSFEIKRDRADATNLLNKMDRKLSQPSRGYQQSNTRTSTNATLPSEE